MGAPSATLRSQLREALAQQDATAEVLRVIAQSPARLDRVFEIILANAARLCAAQRANLFRAEGDEFRLVASKGHSRDDVEDLARGVHRNATSFMRRLLKTRQPIHIRDLKSHESYRRGEPITVAAVERRHIRTLLQVPLLVGDKIWGYIGLSRDKVSPFSDTQIALVENFAAQAVIAIENARLLAELRGSLDRQTASSEVLGVISSSPGELRPVFDAILENAIRICEAQLGILFRYDGSAFTPAAMHGVPAAFVEFLQRGPLRPGPASALAIVRETKQTLRHHDTGAERGYLARDPLPVAAVDLGGTRSAMFVPILKDDELVGIINIFRQEVRPFSDKQIELVENFAKQAVIAIENARLLGELRESLENQTATGEILRTIASSPGDAQRAIDAIAETTAQMFGATSVVIRRLYDEDLHIIGSAGPAAAVIKAQFPQISIKDRSIVSQTVLENRQIHVAHLAQTIEDSALNKRAYEANIRVTAATPLTREGQAIGVMAVNRSDERPYTEKELAVMRGFADQAVVAIENARLLAELRESLEQQTATAEVLRVISSSPGALDPVFKAMLENALRTSGATIGLLCLHRGDGFEIVSTLGLSDAYVDAAMRFARNPGSGTAVGQVMASKRTVQILDMKATEAFARGDPLVTNAVREGCRTILAVPMLQEDKLVGAIVVFRPDVREFAPKEVALVENFAAQAVIAIENTRLLTELRESLERQTATSQVLGVISSSPGDLAPVFDTILDNAMRLCEAGLGTLFQVRSEGLHVAAARGANPAYQAYLRGLVAWHPNPELPLVRALLRKEPVHLADIREDPQHRAGDPDITRFVALANVRTALWVPIVKDDEAVGVITVYRQEIRPFSEKQIELVKNFAAQAVIAIENTRLLTELRESLESQTASADILRTIASSPADAGRALDTIARTAARMFGASSVSIRRIDGETMRLIGAAGPVSERIRAEIGDVPLARTMLPALAALEKRQIVVDDIEHPPSEVAEIFANAPVPGILRDSGVRSIVATPLLREGVAIGAMLVHRAEPRTFSDKELALLQSFADQSVIAIENARLLNELRESLDTQTATSNVLGVISSSPGQLEPVFEAALDNAIRICDAQMGILYRYEGDGFRRVTVRGMTDVEVAQLPTALWRPGPTSAFMRAVETRRAQQFADARQGPAILAGDPFAVAVVDVLGICSFFVVPIFKEDELLGAIQIFRREIRPFGDKQVALVENFARQAVIAIENARLLTELRESLDTQTATSNVLGVISSSPGQLDPVFETILDNAMRLCEANVGHLYRLEGGMLYPASVRGATPEYEAFLRETGSFRPAPEEPPTIVMRQRQALQYADVRELPAYLARLPRAQAAVELGRARTCLFVPMVREGEPVGVIFIYRHEVRPFTEKHVALVENFARQAVIAIENARLLTELRQRTDELAQRQAELRVTFDNMGDGVVMFDEQYRLAAWNKNLQEILGIPDGFFAAPKTYRDYIGFLIERGEFGEVDYEAELRRYTEVARRPQSLERSRPDGHIIEVRVNPVPSGGFVIIYSDITERKRAEEQIHAARDAAERALNELKIAQASLIQSEKMASLGQLTAGIAHEIKNPLNFVNNFADLSVELLDELKETAAPALAALSVEKRGSVDEVVELLTGNLAKIAEHGRRADGIVKSMLAHSRGGSGERQTVSINALVEESLNLAYHGARAQDQSFNITLERDLDPSIGPVEIVPQDITRVFLNLFGNGFYAANKRHKEANDPALKPVLRVTTRGNGSEVVIRIRDNGVGIPPEHRARLFEPFFTTKPTGEGTGLGLSISYDIVTQEHGGAIEVESELGAFTEFTVRLPRRGNRGTGQFAAGGQS